MSKQLVAPKDVTNAVRVLRDVAKESEDPALMDAWNRLAFCLSEKCVNIVLNPRPTSGRSKS
jgi:hypothetical protein